MSTGAAITPEEQAPALLSAEEIAASAAWIAAGQAEDGELSWWAGGKGDPWDHVHSAMGLLVGGRIDEARHAYRWLASTQTEQGGWYAWREGGEPTNRTQETNHAAYPATGLWQYWLATGDGAFLEEMWPVLDSAMAFVESLAADDGTFYWAISAEGDTWPAALQTGCASIHGSWVCAERIARELGHERPAWTAMRRRLGTVLREERALLRQADVVDRVGRFSMDWYYPVLGGAIRGQEAHDLLLDPNRVARYMAEGVGCRCVDDHPWYTTAETCELVLALDACGLTDRAREVFGWMSQFRQADGRYYTGKTWPENVYWPEEDNLWTASAVLVANDALAGTSATADLFTSLDAADLD